MSAAHLAFVFAGAWLLSFTSLLTASPSGLNNIPTADTPPDKTLVLQLYSNQRQDDDDDYIAGFKFGVQPWGQRLEFGLDGRLGEGEEGPVVAQAKYAIQPWEALPAFALGIANLAFTSDDRNDAGGEFTYAVLSHDFKLIRAHVGYGFQEDNNAAFFGIDKTFTFIERDLTLRGDCIQIEDQEQWLASAGFMYVLHKHLVVESWVSQPLEDGDPFITLKLNFVVGF